VCNCPASTHFANCPTSREALIERVTEFGEHLLTSTVHTAVAEDLMAVIAGGDQCEEAKYGDYGPQCQLPRIHHGRGEACVWATDDPTPAPTTPTEETDRA
jgi:hypothetical protein